MPTPENPNFPIEPIEGTVPLTGADIAPSAIGSLELSANGAQREVIPPNVPVETVRLRTGHHGPCACPLCGEPMQEITITRECWSKRLIVRAENVAAYRCDPDDYVKPDITAQIEFLSEALHRIGKTRDRETATFLRQQLGAMRKIEQRLSAASAA
jgi:hypothetical protein